MLTKNRQFQWISSVNGSPEALDTLDKRMNSYYSEWETRSKYQGQINNPDHHQPVIEEQLVKSILRHHPSSILEVGCGSGRLYERFRSAGFKESYSGLEMSKDVIEANTKKYKNATWIHGSAYTKHLADAPFDAIFAYFVLEHCIFPERALIQMSKFLNKGGTLTLVFPDYVTARLFSSQQVGLKDGLAKEHLKRGDILNAFITLYDSRIRLPRAIENAKTAVGPFPVNLNPRCLIRPCAQIPDTDAVYLSSKDEVKRWAEGNGYSVEFPAGVEGTFRDNALIQITKSF
jgi:SAM-dependent methyltransferase